MSIKIKRSTGWEGSATKMQIIVNGEKLATINKNEILEVELPSDKNSLKVRQFGVRSNEIEVKDGDILEVKYKVWYQAIFPLIIAITFIMSVVLDLPYNSRILPVHILFVIITFIPKGFILKKTK